MKCDNCKQEAERLYDLVLFACGLRYRLCEKCYNIAIGKGEQTSEEEDKQETLSVS